jgi:hypothetical protein
MGKIRLSPSQQQRYTDLRLRGVPAPYAFVWAKQKTR